MVEGGWGICDVCFVVYVSLIRVFLLEYYG